MAQDERVEDSMTGRYCLAKLDEMIDVVRGLDDETANAAPGLTGANSAYQILSHCLGMARQWTAEHILGEPTGRDRAAEFGARGDVAELVARARATRDQLAVDLSRMEPGMQVPGRPGVDTFWSHDVEGILLHVLEELCQHLGHLEITRDLVTRGS
ncbi:DUF664 domain-containing protein [Ornithinimicrobium pratense]|uniref:DUF664 domain-containing protein n=1 Tax=Ornithinimicrobium pratense TaxID=2593973 RepID=A0A5J6V753_9MICO|nr:DUF664 domain-containing protein [Ornithinimicrobium pratense]QFG69659.1 DUF664 domain-containing protein [Ornithinimicrobium pratense]